MLTPSIAGSAKLQSLPTNAASEPEFSGLPVTDKTILLNKYADGDLKQFLQALAYDRKLKAKRRIRLNKFNPVSLTEIGEAHLANKKFGRARDAFLDALRNDETYLPAYIKLVDTLLAMGKISDALQQAQRGIFHTDNHIAVLNKSLMCKIILIGEERKNEKDVSEKVDKLAHEFKTVLKVHSTNEEAVNLHGIFFALTLQDYKKALAEFDKLRKLNNLSLDGLNNTGLCYWNMGEIDKAVKYIEQALEIDPRFSSAYQNLINMYALNDKNEKALETLDKAIENKIALEGHWDLIKGYLLIETGKYRAALKWHQGIKSKYKDNDRYLNNIGFCHEKLGNSDKAIEYYEASIDAVFAAKRISLDQPPHQFYNLMILARANNKTKLVQLTAKKLMNINPNDPAAYYFLNGELIGRDTAVVAKRALKKRIEVNPQDADAYANLTFIQTSIDQDYDETIKTVESAEKVIKDQASVLNNLIYAYIKKGDLKSAERLLNSPVANEHNPALHATRGLLALHKGNFSEAKKLYEKAIEQLSSNESSMRFAKQVWAYEKGNYFWSVGNRTKAVSSLKTAITSGDVSYAYEDARKLLGKIEKEKK